MMKDFLAHSSALLGIDIGTRGIKLLELAGNANACTVKSFARVAYETGWPDNKAAAETLISTSLQKAIRQSGTLTRNAALAIPFSESITRSISLPAGLAPDELLARVELEADQQLPYSLDELYWDFTRQDKQDASVDRVEIVLVASRRDYVEDRIALAEQSGLRVKVLDIETCAMENAVIAYNTRMNQVYQSHAVLMIDESITRFSLIHDDGTTQAHELRDITADCHETLAHEIRQILSSRDKTRPGTWPDIIQLGGEITGLDSIATHLQTLLDIPSVVIDPLAGMDKAPPGRLSPGPDASPAFLLACGLALRAFDP